MEKVKYPAVLVLSAKRTRGGTVAPYFFGCLDTRILHSDTDVQMRLTWWQQLEENGGAPYTYTLANVDDAERVLEERRAEVEAEINFGTTPEPDDEAGDAATPPASESPPAEEEPAEDDTTDTGSGQDGNGPPPTVVLTVLYEGTGQSVIPTGPRLGATCPLVGYNDGRHDRPPDKNVARLRLWLQERGYQPSFTEWKWLDRGPGPRRRREVYRLNGDAGYDVIDQDFLRQYAKENQPPGRDLSEAERLERYREGALAGRAPWQICPDCPDLHNCPTGYQACERRQAWVEQRRRQRERPKLFVPGLVG